MNGINEPRVLRQLLAQRLDDGVHHVWCSRAVVQERAKYPRGARSNHQDHVNGGNLLIGDRTGSQVELQVLVVICATRRGGSWPWGGCTGSV
jgi:hypothetical protein